jgi:hypothetical protein
MQSNRLTTALLLATAATGVAHLVLAEQRHRDRIALESARIHQQLIAAQVERPGLRAIWGSLAHLDSPERRLHLHRNAWLSAWEVMFRVGTLSTAQVREAAGALFATPDGQTWWARIRGERVQHATDRRGRQFQALVDSAYQDETGTV